jgi:methionyl-tRNA formyltransferase
VLDIPKYHCVNVHGSLLPKYRGAAPIQWSVLNGDEVTGITTMLMAEGMDTGDILMQCTTPIGENETAAELFDRLAVMGADLLIQTLEKLEKGELTPVKQDDNEATYASMLTKEMCMIDFSKPVREVHKKICGLSDWPCAVTMLNGKRLKVYRSEIVPSKGGNAADGTVIDTQSFCVKCADGVVRFTEVQAEGSRRMNVQDYLRGNPIKSGIILGMEKSDE